MKKRTNNQLYTCPVLLSSNTFKHISALRNWLLLMQVALWVLNTTTKYWPLNSIHDVFTNGPQVQIQMYSTIVAPIRRVVKYIFLTR
jgi:hypothetical protein